MFAICSRPNLLHNGSNRGGSERVRRRRPRGLTLAVAVLVLLGMLGGGYRLLQVWARWSLFQGYPEITARVLAYDSLTEADRLSITIEWTAAPVELLVADGRAVIASSGQVLNLEGLETYTVTFQTSMDGLLGPIVVYLDKNLHRVLGQLARY